MTPKTCAQAWIDMTEASRSSSIYNYTQILDMSDYLVETELFPRPVLEAYSAWNLEDSVADAERGHFTMERGGGQGDYRLGMGQKIANVVDCLRKFPQSKRAVITISNHPDAHHFNDAQAKCMRELHLRIDADGTLCGSVFFRAQAALIFPKNIHFIGSLMSRVTEQLPTRPKLGTLFYLTSVLVSDRS